MSRALRFANEAEFQDYFARMRPGGAIIAKGKPAASNDDSGKTARPQRDPLKIYEDDLQITCFEYVEKLVPRFPILKWLLHIPNGGKRSRGTAGRMKAMGVKKGAVDMVLMFRYGPWAGLSIELKVGNNTPTEDQVEWLETATEHGYYTAVCWTFEEFQAHLHRFLGI